MTGILLHHFSPATYISPQLSSNALRLSSNRTGQSLASSTESKGRTDSLSQTLLPPKTKQKATWNMSFMYWLSLLRRPWTGSVTTATVRGTLALYGYLATAFSPAIKVISLMGNKFVRAVAHTHVITQAHMHVGLPCTFLKRASGLHRLCNWNMVFIHAVFLHVKFVLQMMVCLIWRCRI